MPNPDQNSSFFKDLFDFKLRKYITRRVASAIYLLYLIMIPISTLILTYVAYSYARMQFPDRNFHWQLLGIWILGPILGFITLVYTRILIELNIAVVNIAENTEPKD